MVWYVNLFEVTNSTGGRSRNRRLKWSMDTRVCVIPFILWFSTGNLRYHPNTTFKFDTRWVCDAAILSIERLTKVRLMFFNDCWYARLQAALMALIFYTLSWCSCFVFADKNKYQYPSCNAKSPALSLMCSNCLGHEYSWPPSCRILNLNSNTSWRLISYSIHNVRFDTTKSWVQSTHNLFLYCLCTWW